MYRILWTHDILILYFIHTHTHVYLVLYTHINWELCEVAGPLFQYQVRATALAQRRTDWSGLAGRVGKTVILSLSSILPKFSSYTCCLFCSLQVFSLLEGTQNSDQEYYQFCCNTCGEANSPVQFTWISHKFRVCAWSCLWSCLCTEEYTNCTTVQAQTPASYFSSCLFYETHSLPCSDKPL